MRFMLILIVTVPLVAASHIRTAGLRGLRSALYANTTTWQSSMGEAASPTKIETSTPETSSTVTETTSFQSTTTLRSNPDLSSHLVTESTALASATTLRSSSRASSPVTESTVSEHVTTMPHSASVSKQPVTESTTDEYVATTQSSISASSAVMESTTGDSATTIRSSSRASSTVTESTAFEPASPLQSTPRSSRHLTTESTTSDDATTIRNGPSATSASVTTMWTSSSSSSNAGTKSQNSNGLNTVSGSDNDPAPTTGLPSPDMPRSTGTASPGPQPGSPVTSDETVVTTSLDPPTVDATAPPPAHSTTAPIQSAPETPGRSAMTIQSTGTVSSTAPASIQHVSSQPQPDRMSRTEGTAYSQLASVSAASQTDTDTKSFITAIAKLQTAMHAAAIDASTTVVGSGWLPAPSRVESLRNATMNPATQGRPGSREPTRSAVTLSSLVAAATTLLTENARPTGGPSSAQSPAFKQGLPRVILPATSSSPSVDSTAIQLGFRFPLNYVFVSQHLQAAAQIFEVLPETLAQGTVQRMAVQVARLVPYDTQAALGYITTVAKLYYPKPLVDQLQRDILNPDSKIYTAGGDMQRSLAALIDPAVKITDDNGGLDCGSQLCDASSSGTSSSAKDKGITAGAVVGGAALCGALGLGLFQAVRLYRRRGSRLTATWPWRQRRAGRFTGRDISRPIAVTSSVYWNQL